jgi:hypothetical protein
MREAAIQAKFIRTVNALGLGLAVKVDCSNRRGWPDVIFIDNSGRTTYIEFKADSGRLSVHQKACHAELIALGAHVLVIVGEDGLNALLRTMGADPLSTKERPARSRQRQTT